MQSIEQAQIVSSEFVDSGSKAETIVKSCAGKGEKVRAMLRARLGEDIYTSWFRRMEFDSFDGRVGASHGAGQIPEELDPIALRRRSAGMLRRGIHGCRAGRHCPAPAGYSQGRTIAPVG